MAVQGCREYVDLLSRIAWDSCPCVDRPVQATAMQMNTYGTGAGRVGVPRTLEVSGPAGFSYSVSHEDRVRDAD